MRARRGAVSLPPRTTAVAVIAAIAIASALAGFAADRLVLKSRGVALTLPDTGFHRLSSILRSPTDEERRRLRAQLATELNLTTAQAHVVDSIMDAHTGEYRQLRDEIRPRVEQLTTAVRSDVERVLTPEQRDRYRQLSGRPATPDSAAKGGSK